MNNWPNPFIEQRADPFILRHLSHYYFIASVPEYDRLEIRRVLFGIDPDDQILPKHQGRQTRRWICGAAPRCHCSACRAKI